MLESSLEDRQREQRLVRTRAIVAGVFVVLGLSLILARLFHLQLELHEHFTVLSTENRVKIQPVPPNRGLIFDAKGVVLAENHPSFSLVITIEKVGDLKATIDELKKLIPIEDGDLSRFERLKRQRMRFQPVPIRLNLTSEEVARFAVDGYRFPGVEVHAELIRTYPKGELTAHVLGYVGRINEKELARIDKGNYAGTNFIGKGGVELAHEDVLHGKVGYQQVEVNARGRILRTLESTPPAPGQDLYLYLDIALQQAATEALGENRGSIVAIDPRSGGVLALVSTPSFDPNLFVEGISQSNYDALLHSPDKPLYNRAIRGQYPPGSTVKPFIGLGGLSLGFVTPRKSTFCPGYFSLPGQKHRFRCWRRGGHGTVDLELGIVQSCDVYFYWLANQMGVDKLHAFLSEFGFGSRTGVDVSGELPGLLPSREWKERVRKQPWYPGETLIMGIGQGYFLATPMQLAAATAALANKGHFIQPRLAYARRVPGADVATVFPTVARQIQITNPGDWDIAIEDMAKVVESQRGTAKRIHSNDYRIAGKTGTSQVFTIGQKERYDASKISERLRDHALFVAFAPVEDPRIAVAVMVENGGSGSGTAAPIARRVIDAYLGGTPLPDESGETPDGD
ncbi:penicillin-binding protein 2 [Allochromatium vinosum]|uniref:Peptidoglycan D,D-transpeptidase MrdA n=1 Tax=Allochromatium vinosum (strain ATCC 17899 / DSM 180 / NBRC 103801 / NCIMB 10441 / D) TaxID=572477 RepID=D3RQT3_ALLVD|nr:penicillin-binding protein 2 [Allochromatium vinosum]ADC63767.1 penicillin-binding protein 2 [Allochromatium vinosum DSM 180]MBK1653723.1 penicillin-binding protein 2 [Allochromatium vinosum]